MVSYREIFNQDLILIRDLLWHWAESLPGNSKAYIPVFVFHS